MNEAEEHLQKCFVLGKSKMKDVIYPYFNVIKERMASMLSSELEEAKRIIR